MEDCENKINMYHFMDLLLKSILKMKYGRYVPLAYYLKGLELSSFASIVKATADVLNNFKTSSCSSTHRAFKNVISVLLNFDECVQFIQLFGNHIFEQEVFFWDLFRAFLAFVCELSSILFEKRKMYLSSCLIVASASYIEKELLQKNRIRSLGGWEAFQVDCIKIDLKNEEVEAIEDGKFKSEKWVFLEEQEYGVLYSYDGETLGHIRASKNYVKLDFSRTEDAGNNCGDNAIAMIPCSESENFKILHFRTYMLAHFMSAMGTLVVKLMKQRS